MRVTLHMVCSIDGFIASKDNSIGWLEDDGGVFEGGKTLTSEDAAAFVKTIDCYILGSRTYEHALKLGWPYGEMPVIVLTRRELQQVKPTVTFFSGNVAELIGGKLPSIFQNVWVAGGADAGHQFLQANLVDEIRMTIAPVMLGGGLRFFQPAAKETRWLLRSVTPWRNGYVELLYSAKRPASSEPPASAPQ